MRPLAKNGQIEEFFFANEASGTARALQRRAAAGELVRIAPGVYTRHGEAAEIESRIRRNWQVLAGHFAEGAVVSHLSAFRGGIIGNEYVTLSHPTQFNKTIKLPGLSLILLKGPGELPGDLPLRQTDLFWSSRARTLLENLGSVMKKRPTRAGRDAVEERLVEILNANQEDGLNRLRDEARALAPMLGAESAFDKLNSMVAALLNTHDRGALRTRRGQLVAQGTPEDSERIYRFEILANALRTTVLPTIPDVAPGGLAKIHFAFIESYFSNYVEGTRFSIEEAEGIVLRNQLVQSRPKDSHDVLGVFNLAMQPGTRDSVPPPGEAFIDGLQERHRLMLGRRPESQPGELKRNVNYAGTTRFVEPAYVRGTLRAGSEIAKSVPEGMARAIFYAFLISEVHPFEDGNGRLSRLTMNAELSRLGLCRIIVPTLFHPQYVDCQRALTQSNDPQGFLAALARAANWCAQFDYENLPALVEILKSCHAFEESPAQFHLLNQDGSRAA